LIKNAIAIAVPVTKSLQLGSCLRGRRWLLHDLEISLILRMHLLSLSLYHIHISTICGGLSLTSASVPFRSLHFLYRIERCSTFIAPLIYLFVIKSLLILFAWSDFMQVDLAHILIVLLVLVRIDRNTASILHNLKLIILLLLTGLILT